MPTDPPAALPPFVPSFMEGKKKLCSGPQPSLYSVLIG